jgi:hypothetical protein
MRTNNFALRLPQSLYDNLRVAALKDGVAMNQYVAIALAEKLATRSTAQQFLQERAAGSSLSAALAILDRAGTVDAEPTVY